MAATLTGTGAFSFSSPSFPFPAAAAFPAVLVLARATSRDVPLVFSAAWFEASAAALDFRWMYRPAAEAATTSTSSTDEKTKARLRREVEFIRFSGLHGHRQCSSVQRRGAGPGSLFFPEPAIGRGLRVVAGGTYFA